jgi:hypothetical protein
MCTGKPGTDGTFSDTLCVMARLFRIVVVNIPHHVTQRGNARQFILTCDAERLVYLNLLRKYVQFHEISCWVTELFSYDSLNRLSTAETLSTNQPWYQGDQPWYRRLPSRPITSSFFHTE